MEIEEVAFLTYEQVLEAITGQENHLLIGNGFNRGLGINTSYYSIFHKMIESNHGIYKDAASLAAACNYDLELFIGELVKDINPHNIFLQKYISNKIKMDFMQATHEIVKAEIKQIYTEKNEGVFMLLRHFTNYFTLNFDSFLYLLLLNYKSTSSTLEKTISLQASLKFMEEDVSTHPGSIFEEIKRIREGVLSIKTSEFDNPTNSPIDKVTKATFTTIIKQYAKSTQRNWKNKEIEQAVDLLLEMESQNRILEKVDDGAQLLLFGGVKEYVFDVNSRTQNLFFLHGAFHLYQDGKSVKKITQQTDKALYERLESILNSEEQDVVCVFQSVDKMAIINENAYLSKCYNKLSQLSGNIVILGSALSANDVHVFNQINRSEISTIFISTTKYTESKAEEAKSIFPDKKIYFFDANTISYKMPEQI